MDKSIHPQCPSLSDALKVYEDTAVQMFNALLTVLQALAN